MSKRKEIKIIIEYAEGLGFQVDSTNSNHLKFKKEGCVTVYTSSTPSDHRAFLNIKSQLKRALKQTLSICNEASV